MHMYISMIPHYLCPRHPRPVECSLATRAGYRFATIDEVDACIANEDDASDDRNDDNENVGDSTGGCAGVAFVVDGE